MLQISSFMRPTLRHVLDSVLALCAAAACPAVMALTITGTPANSVVAGTTYSFTPAISGATSGRTVVFRIANKPSWATFSSSNGRLSGAPSSAYTGQYKYIAIAVSDGASTATMPAFMVTVHTKDTAPPALLGTPPRSVTAGSLYSFQPAVKATPGNSCYFTIHNKPVWATFSIRTGLLTGTPTSAEVGTYNNIEIYCNDGQMVGHTPSFSITVSPRVGHARLYWIVPTENTDGTELTDLAGYRLYYGRSPSDLSNIIEVPEPWARALTIENLAASTWYFGITAYTTGGLESSVSQIVSKSVD